MPSSIEIAVVGAGVGGLTAALALVQLGHKVAVYEQSEALLKVGAGVQISSNGGYVLEALGVFKDLTNIACLGKGVEIFDHKSRNIAFIDLENFCSGPSHLMLYRHELILLLQKRCSEAGVKFYFGEKLLGISCFERPRFETNKLQRSVDLLVCSDGIHSVGRETVLGKSCPSYFTGHVAWRAIVPDISSHPAATRIYLGPNKHIVSYPLHRGGMINLVMVEERSVWVKESWTEKGSTDELRTVFASFTGGVSELLDKVEEPNIWGLFRHQVADAWYKGAVVLLGDAAHPTLPFMAQGANLALEDAWVLAKYISKAKDLSQGLKEYQDKRLSRAQKVVSEAEKNAWKYHLAFPPFRWLAHRTVQAMSTFAPRQIVRQFDWIYGYDVTKLD